MWFNFVVKLVKMSHELESATESLLFRMNLSSDDERVEAFDKLREEFCEHCGRKIKDGGFREITGCHCQNEE